MTDTRPTVIADRLGSEQAARLSAIVGGTRLYVPPVLTDAGRLKRTVGEPLAVLLVLHFGGSRIKVPTGTGAGGSQGTVDIKRVARLLRKGWSNSRIARKLGASERTIERKRAILRRDAISNADSGGMPRGGPE